MTAGGSNTLAVVGNPAGYIATMARLLRADRYTGASTRSTAISPRSCVRPSGVGIERVGAISLQVVTHPIRMLGVVALTEDPLSGARSVSVLGETVFYGRVEVGS